MWEFQCRQDPKASPSLKLFKSLNLTENAVRLKKKLSLHSWSSPCPQKSLLVLSGTREAFEAFDWLHVMKMFLLCTRVQIEMVIVELSWAQTQSDQDNVSKIIRLAFNFCMAVECEGLATMPPTTSDLHNFHISYLNLANDQFYQHIFFVKISMDSSFTLFEQVLRKLWLF
jgi:hypothetical protein